MAARASKAKGADLGALAKRLEDKGVRPVYIVQGGERLMVDEAVRAILRAAVDNPKDPMQVTRVDLADPKTDVRDVLGACQSLGLFAGRSAVLVRSVDLLDKSSSDRDQVADYIDKPNPQATLVLIATKLNGSSKLVKRAAKAGEVLTFNPLRARDVPNWLIAEANNLGHKMSMGTARLVADLVGTDLQQLRLVVDQLSLYVGPGQPIREAAVEELLASTRAHSIFELVDAVGQRNTAQALEHLHSMLEHREPALRILGMLIRHFRMLWQLGAGRAQGRNLDDMTSTLRLHPYQAKKMWQQTQRFDHATLASAYDRLYVTDLRLKGVGLDDPTVLETLVLDLCTARG